MNFSAHKIVQIDNVNKEEILKLRGVCYNVVVGTSSGLLKYAFYQREIIALTDLWGNQVVVGKLLSQNYYIVTYFKNYKVAFADICLYQCVAK